jgi:hypothetical protein
MLVENTVDVLITAMKENSIKTIERVIAPELIRRSTS